MLIKNAKIITMEDKNYENGYIHIINNKISSIGDMSELLIQDDLVIDAKGKLVLPGFVEAHSHIGICNDGIGFEGDDVNEETDPITPQLRALDAINSFDYCFQEAFHAGVTTVLTGPGSANPISGQFIAMKTYGNRVDDMLIKEPVGMKFALGENPKVTYNSKNQSPITRMGIASLIREQLMKAKRYMEDMEDAQKDDELDEPEYDNKCEALIPVLKREIKAFFHAHRADDIFTAIRIAKEFNLDYVIVHGTEGYKIADTLKKENVKIITGPIMTDRSKPELREQTVRNTGILAKAGIDVAICTDHPETPIQYLALTTGIAVKEGLSYDDALKAITINAARIAGISNRVGSIKINKDADILIFNTNPLEIISTPETVIINGKIVKGGENECAQ